MSGYSDGVWPSLEWLTPFYNNAILYRAVLVTDWIFSLFYLSAFYYSADLITRGVLRVLGEDAPRCTTLADSAMEISSLRFDARTLDSGWS